MNGVEDSRSTSSDGKDVTGQGKEEEEGKGQEHEQPVVSKGVQFLNEDEEKEESKQSVSFNVEEGNENKKEGGRTVKFGADPPEMEEGGRRVNFGPDPSEMKEGAEGEDDISAGEDFAMLPEKSNGEDDVTTGEEFGTLPDHDDEDEDEEVSSSSSINLDELSEDEILEILKNNSLDGEDEDDSVVSHDDEGHRGEGGKFPVFLYSPPGPLPQTPFEKFMSYFKNCANRSDSFRNYAAHMVVVIALQAAARPRITVGCVIGCTLGMMVAAAISRPIDEMYNVEIDFLFSPLGTQTMMQSEWFFKALLDPDDPSINRRLPIPEGLLSGNSGGRRSRMVLEDAQPYNPHVDSISSLFDNSNNLNVTTEENRLDLSPLAAFNTFPYRQNTIAFHDEQNNNGFHDEQNHRNLRLREDDEVIFPMVIHADGANVMSLEGFKRIDEIVDMIKNFEGYDYFCGGEFYRRAKNNCAFVSAYNLLPDGVVPQTDTELLELLSLPNIIDKPIVLGNLQFVDGTDKTEVESAQAFLFVFQVFFANDDYGVVSRMERGLLEEFKAIGQRWANEDGNIYRFDGMSSISIAADLLGSIIKDLPLVFSVFLVMIAFTALVFFKCDKVKSRCLLGMGGVFTICCSMSTGAALMLLFGIPFTPMTMVVPFLMFGVGLDDTFVIVGEYNRTHADSDVLHRIRETMEEVAVSIITTTLTTTISFIFGGFTCSLPAIRYLCFWAAPMIMIDFFYQITMFVALVVLDEGRITQNRSDCIVCCIVGRNEIVGSNGVRKTLAVAPQHRKKIDSDPAERVMKWYAERLMLPRVRKAVVVIFSAAFLFFGYRLSLMTQEFSPTELVPSDSVIKGFFTSMQSYSNRYIKPYIVFRFVDQSDLEIQEQMIDFIEDITDIPGFGEAPPLCWLLLYREELEKKPAYAGMAQKMRLNEQFEFLENLDPDAYQMIEPMIGRFTRKNEEKDFVVSFCDIYVNELDMSDANAQMAFINRIKEVEANHPMNEGRALDEYPFFTFNPEWYPIWELFLKAIPELISTIGFSVLAVALVGFFIIPHWSGMLFILPTIVILLVDLIGWMQLIGIRINPISYIALVIAIGLMVDYIVHILIRYYESTYVHPIDRVKDTLATMGASILTGGLSTFLGFCPMLFSKSEIFIIVANTIISMVVISLLHGLILLPVVLSYIGPTETHIASKGQAQV